MDDKEGAMPRLQDEQARMAAAIAEAIEHARRDDRAHRLALLTQIERELDAADAHEARPKGGQHVGTAPVLAGARHSVRAWLRRLVMDWRQPGDATIATKDFERGRASAFREVARRLRARATRLREDAGQSGSIEGRWEASVRARMWDEEAAAIEAMAERKEPDDGEA